MPLVVVLALVIGTLSGGSSPSGSSSSGPTGTPPQAAAPVTVSPPPPNPAADAPCTALLATLPQTLQTSDGPLAARPAFSSSPYVAAWGDPAIVLRCGVPRPSQLTPGSADLLLGVNGVFFLPVGKGGDDHTDMSHGNGADTTVFVAVDRTAYVEVSVPGKYRQPPLGPLASAIAAAMPTPVCVVDPNEADLSKLCTRRP